MISAISTQTLARMSKRRDNSRGSGEFETGISSAKEASTVDWWGLLEALANAIAKASQWGWRSIAVELCGVRSASAHGSPEGIFSTSWGCAIQFCPALLTDEISAAQDKRQ